MIECTWLSDYIRKEDKHVQDFISRIPFQYGL